MLAIVLLDVLWLGVVMAAQYKEMIGHLMADRPDFAAAGAFYLLYGAGVTFFAVRPALAAGRAGTALGLGAALGFLAYMTYELTNRAILRDWPMSIVVIDIAWGVVVTSLSAFAGFRAAARLSRASGGPP